MKALGEGIEDRAQFEHLQREQCDLGQGFLFSRPLEAAGVDEFLTRSDATNSTARAAVTPLTIA